MEGDLLSRGPPHRLDVQVVSKRGAQQITYRIFKGVVEHARKINVVPLVIRERFDERVLESVTVVTSMHTSSIPR